MKILLKAVLVGAMTVSATGCGMMQQGCSWLRCNCGFGSSLFGSSGSTCDTCDPCVGDGYTVGSPVIGDGPVMDGEIYEGDVLPGEEIDAGAVLP